MTRLHRSSLVLAAALATLGGCRNYDYTHHVASQKGLVPADKFATYGHEQAIAVAIGREFARPYNSGPEQQADITVNYARNKFGKDIESISADPQGNRIVVTFTSGWRTAIVPIDDGKTGDQTTIPS